MIGNFFIGDTIAEQEKEKKITISRDTIQRENENENILNSGGTNNFYTPSVEWYQTPKSIKIIIKIIGVEDNFKIYIIRKKFFKFRLI